MSAMMSARRGSQSALDVATIEMGLTRLRIWGARQRPPFNPGMPRAFDSLAIEHATRFPVGARIDDRSGQSCHLPLAAVRASYPPRSLPRTAETPLYLLHGSESPRALVK